MQSVYNKFAAARVEHLFFGVHASYLAAARARMRADPGYDESKEYLAVDNSERALAKLRSLLA
jgi:hypothetical protein